MYITVQYFKNSVSDNTGTGTVFFDDNSTLKGNKSTANVQKNWVDGKDFSYKVL